MWTRIVSGAGLTPIHPVVEQPVKVALVDKRALLVAEPIAAEFPRQHRSGAELNEPLENPAHRRGLGFVDDQLAVDRVVVIAEGHIAVHPHALLLRDGDLVADAFADHLALEPGEGEQDVQRQPSH